MWKMSPHMYNLCCFVVKLILSRFAHFCRKICFVAIYALLCGEKLNQKLPLWRKNDKYQVCSFSAGATCTGAGVVQLKFVQKYGNAFVTAIAKEHQIKLGTAKPGKEDNREVFGKR